MGQRTARREDDRIEAIVKLSGELNVVKNAFGHAINAAPTAETLQRLQAQLDRLTSALLREALATRVLPLRQVMARFPRLVREMAAGLNKQVRLVTEGEATEADKTIVEALFEPILHVLRNAVDHGVEAPERRQKAGKPAAAVITLRARRQADQVIIEIEDDGAGINVAGVQAAAAARGIPTAGLDDAAVRNLIFAAGFSTRSEISALSGRGVGMDAVRIGIERLGGHVGVESVAGRGTVIRFLLPFTVMMTRILLVDCGDQAFGIPFEAVVETLTLPAVTQKIGAAEILLLRGETLPLIRLEEVLGLGAAGDAALRSAVVIEAGGARAVLAVDRLRGQFEIMLTPMAGLLAGMPWVAGTTLLGDGRVLVVLELGALLA